MTSPKIEDVYPPGRHRTLSTSHCLDPNPKHLSTHQGYFAHRDGRRRHHGHAMPSTPTHRLFEASRIHLIVPSGSTLGVAGAGDSPPNETGGVNQGSSASEGASHGLSLGAKVAIGVVIPVVFLAIAALGLFFLLRYRKRRLGTSGQVQTTPNEPELENHQISEKDATDSKSSQQELYGQETVRATELRATAATTMHELGTTSPATTHELHGTRYNLAELDAKEIVQMAELDPCANPGSKCIESAD